jgi:hypothetical protein
MNIPKEPSGVHLAGEASVGVQLAELAGVEGRLAVGRRRRRELLSHGRVGEVLVLVGRGAGLVDVDVLVTTDDEEQSGKEMGTAEVHDIQRSTMTGGVAAAMANSRDARNGCAGSAAVLVPSVQSGGFPSYMTEICHTAVRLIVAS